MSSRLPRTDRRYPALLLTGLAGWSAVSAVAADPAAVGLTGGGGPPPAIPCVSPAEHAHVRQVIEAQRAARGESDHRGAAPRRFPFYPLGGTLYGDLFSNNFNDLNPGAGILDWDCTDFTYNGHDATDVDLRTFGEQDGGVPIFAALDGTVVDAHDGEFDKNTACAGIANYVIIDHGGGRFCYYWHMQIGSVAVIPGQIVRAGQQIGRVGSSGCSTGPHLHFATYDSFNSTEPYAGACRPGDSDWVDQTPIQRSMYLRDFNVTNVLIETYPGLPVDMPRIGSFATGVRGVSFWINLMNMPASSTWRVRYRRPNLSIALDSGTGSFGNPFYRWAWWWWRYNVNLNATGTWHILLDINGQTLIEAPFTVVASPASIVNRAPNPVTVAFDTASPRFEDAIFCRVQTSLTLDDPDYDIVRYRYQWTINGAPVRDVVSAGHADAIPRHGVCLGDEVACTVTPTDGLLDGPPVAVSAIVTPVPEVAGDMDRSGAVEPADLPGFIDVLLGLDADCDARIIANVNGDAAADADDVQVFVQALVGP